MHTVPPRTKKGEIYRQYKLRQEKEQKRWIAKSDAIKEAEEKELVGCFVTILHAQHIAKVAPKERKRRLSKSGMIYKVNQRIKEHQQKMYYKRKYSRLSSKLAKIGLCKDEVSNIIKKLQIVERIL